MAPTSDGSKLGLGLSSGSKTPVLQLSFEVGGGGLNDAAISPCGGHLAAACKDGVCRILSIGNRGELVTGFRSYYGAFLCCTFSPDSR